MNKQNLIAIAEYVLFNVKQKYFDMSLYKDDHCNSTGCAIGHSIALEENPDNYKLGRNIDYYGWAQEFTGIDDEAMWWCFSSKWGDIDNTRQGLYRRIMYLIESPDDILRYFDTTSPELYEDKPLPSAPSDPRVIALGKKLK